MLPIEMYEGNSIGQRQGCSIRRQLMYCLKCGGKNSDAAVYCRHCGSEMPHPASHELPDQGGVSEDVSRAYAAGTALSNPRPANDAP